MASDLVLAGVEDGIAGILLNRPDNRNSWTSELADAYHDALDRAAANDDVKVIVVTGAGETFCTMEAVRPSRAAAQRRSALHPLSIPKPIIGAINGECSGMGLSEALMCDVRFAAETALLSAPYAQRGLALPDAMAWVLPRMVGLGNAMDVVLSGREITAFEATQLGLVQGVHADNDLTERVLEYAAHIATRADGAAAAAVKAQVYRSMEMGLGQAIDDARVMAERLEARN